MTENRYELNKNLAQMLKGGLLWMQNPEQARIAEAAGCGQLLWPWNGFQLIFVQLVEFPYERSKDD